MVKLYKTDVNGVIMWKTCEGEIIKSPTETEIKKQDRYGWNKICVDGKIMWESPDGERKF